MVLKQARETAGLTQEELARRLKTKKKTAISRIENHTEDIKLSTMEKVEGKASADSIKIQDTSPQPRPCPQDLKKIEPREGGIDVWVFRARYRLIKRGVRFLRMVPEFHAGSR